MDDNDLAGWVNSLLPKSQPPLRQFLPLLSYLGAGIVVYLLFSLLVMVAFNSLVPLLHVPSMTFAEALGTSFFYLVLVVTVYLLKESKDG